MDKIELHSGGFPLTTKTFEFLMLKWYHYVVGLILVSTFGFRSMLRKGIEAITLRIASKNKGE